MQRFACGTGTKVRDHKQLEIPVFKDINRCLQHTAIGIDPANVDVLRSLRFDVIDNTWRQSRGGMKATIAPVLSRTQRDGTSRSSRSGQAARTSSLTTYFVCPSGSGKSMTCPKSILMRDTSTPSISSTWSFAALAPMCATVPDGSRTTDLPSARSNVTGWGVKFTIMASP